MNGLIINLQTFLANSLGLQNLFATQASFPLTNENYYSGYLTVASSGGALNITPNLSPSAILLAIDYSGQNNQIINGSTPSLSITPLKLAISLASGTQVNLTVASLLVWNTDDSITDIQVTNPNDSPVSFNLIYG